MIPISINGTEYEAAAGERLIDVINRAGIPLSQVCYHPQLGPIETCDTCIVEVNGELVRACSSAAPHSATVSTTASRAHSARLEAFDRILRNHLLYCTVCDNNNGNCEVHNTTKLLGVEHHECGRHRDERFHDHCGCKRTAATPAEGAARSLLIGISQPTRTGSSPSCLCPHG